MRMKKVNSDAIKLYETSRVKLKVAGNTREVQFTAGNNDWCPIQNISKNEYLNKETGEIKERKKSVSRYQTPKSARIINKLMDLIRCNATEPSHCKWITLTYADAMTDNPVVYNRIVGCISDFDVTFRYILRGVKCGCIHTDTYNPIILFRGCLDYSPFSPKELG